MTLSELFSNFKTSAKRLELLQEYHVGEEWENFEKYRKGFPVPLFDEQKQWNEQIREWKNQGKTVERIRLIDSPVSDYVKFEIEIGYLPSALCGQNVKFVSRKKFNQNNPDKIKKDFWIFDDSIVFEMNYDEKGSFLGGQVVEGSPYIKLYNDLSSHTVSLENIIKQIRLQKTIINL